ncbi:MAG: polyhydroxyalkanoate synthesis repressor PhaR [Pseudomonadota bacterium]
MKDDTPTKGGKASGKSKSGTGAEGEPIIVKKYANRRLYNTATSSYVTLDNLAAMVREGKEFLVQDAKTGEDITRSVLTQIIFEEEAKGRAPLLPTSFLRQIIRLYGDALQGYVPGYLEMTMKSFERNQENFRSHMERSFGQTPGFQQFDAMTRANMEMFRKGIEMFSGLQQGAGTTAPEPTDLEEAEQKEDLAALRDQLREMQRKVDRLTED